MGSFRGREADWLGVDEALARVLADVTPRSGEEVRLARSVGRTLAEDVRARATLPPWDNAAMDGYAARSDDLEGAAPEVPARLRVVGRVHAGERWRGSLTAGQAVRIMTGAPVPPGADSVVRVEDTDAESGEAGWVRVRSGRDRGRNIRPAGRDMAAGDLVLSAGTAVEPGTVALLAAAGHAGVPVTRRPRIAILTTGDELAPVADFDRVLRGEAVPESNGPMLAAAVANAGGEALMLGVAPDDPAGLAEALAPVLDGDPPPDLLLTVGGASMGDADLLKDVLEAAGMVLDFWRVRIRPGSPLSLGRLPTGCPVLSLPGNPASAFVTYHLFARPLIRTMLGSATPHLPTAAAVAGEALPSVEGLCHFHRVVLEDPAAGGVPRARLTGPQGSGLVAGLGRARALAVVPEGVSGIGEGEPVTCLRLDAPLAGRADPGYVGAP